LKVAHHRLQLSNLLFIRFAFNRTAFHALKGIDVHAIYVVLKFFRNTILDSSQNLNLICLQKRVLSWAWVKYLFQKLT
jgi:hypothetical protein